MSATPCRQIALVLATSAPAAIINSLFSAIFSTDSESSANGSASKSLTVAPSLICFWNTRLDNPLAVSVDTRSEQVLPDQHDGTNPVLLERSLNDGDLCVVLLDGSTHHSHESGALHAKTLRHAVAGAPAYLHPSVSPEKLPDASIEMADWLCAIAATGCRLLPVLLQSSSDSVFTSMPKRLPNNDAAVHERNAATDTGSDIGKRFRSVCVRSTHLLHDLELLRSRVYSDLDCGPCSGALNGINGYPVGRYRPKIPLTGIDIESINPAVAREWLVDTENADAQINAGNDSQNKTREEGQKNGPVDSLQRTFQFKSFAQAIHFMDCVSLGCDVADHHPVFLHSYRKLTVTLKTWDAENPCVTLRDIALAEYFDRTYDLNYS